jgi:hypothetical protein
MMDVRKMASMGQRAMRKQQSAAEKVFWPRQAGRRREMKPNLLEAIHIGRKDANKLYADVLAAGLKPEDAGESIVWAKNGKLASVEPISRNNQDSSDLEMAQKALKSKWEPIGVAFALLDREKGNLLTHARAFERTEQNENLLSAVLDDWTLRAKRDEKLRYD